jgi:MFS transporter, OFA family, oxalate/formate antiporter
MVILAIFLGVRNTYGVFLTPLAGALGLSRGAASAFFSVYMTLSAAFAIFCGWALDRLGPKVVLATMGFFLGAALLLTSRAVSTWQIYLTYSLLLAAGTGASFPIVMATVTRLFERSRGVALGIALSGEGVGIVAVAPVASFLVRAYDWRTGMLVLGVLGASLAIGLSLFLRRLPSHEGSASPASTAGMATAVPPSFTLRQAIKTRSFWFLAGVYVTVSLCFNLLITHLVAYSTDIEISAATGALLVSVLGGSTVPGRLLLGWASDSVDRRRLAIACAVVQALAMVWLAFANSLWMFFTFAVVFGFAFGAESNLLASLTSQTFGTGNIGSVAGSLVVGFNVGAAVGPLMAGLVFDSTGRYFVSFLASALAATLAALMLLATRHETVPPAASGGR